MKCDSYLIDHCTLALESVLCRNNKSKITTTMVYIIRKCHRVNCLKQLVFAMLPTMEGRKQAVRKLLNYPRKTPFLISPFDLGVFPTMSSKHLECVWIFNHRFVIDEYEKGKSIITFSEGTKIALQASRHILRKQQKRLHTVIDTFRTIDREKITRRIRTL